MIPEKRRHHTPAAAGVTLDRQTCTNPAPAPARTDDDDYWGEIHKCTQPHETPMIDYLPPIKRGLKYGATHPLKQALSPSLKPRPNQSRDNAYGKIWSAQPPRPQPPSINTAPTHLLRWVPSLTTQALSLEHDDGLNLIPHTCCGGCVVIVVSSRSMKPHDKNRAKVQGKTRTCAATCNLI
ncbi:hypothetical protein BS47DRAFT_1368899 [Hydnum rufescens UP504]|uniref:Uncharacterized protein n=1 Tax=Hydnum rufescens UP504 TaxID=1448309 RepID=A0A9P6AEC4_9AGAM|nr:hypothetical protein BS47DRAFT_1368899 [Hydnum rufescens UP504]